jgi:hypothetical protein
MADIHGKEEAEADDQKPCNTEPSLQEILAANTQRDKPDIPQHHEVIDVDGFESDDFDSVELVSGGKVESRPTPTVKKEIMFRMEGAGTEQLVKELGIRPAPTAELAEQLADLVENSEWVNYSGTVELGNISLHGSFIPVTDITRLQDILAMDARYNLGWKNVAYFNFAVNAHRVTRNVSMGMLSWYKEMQKYAGSATAYRTSEHRGIGSISGTSHYLGSAFDAVMASPDAIMSDKDVNHLVSLAQFTNYADNTELDNNSHSLLGFLENENWNLPPEFYHYGNIREWMEYDNNVGDCRLSIWQTTYPTLLGLLRARPAIRRVVQQIHATNAIRFVKEAGAHIAFNSIRDGVNSGDFTVLGRSGLSAKHFYTCLPSLRRLIGKAVLDLYPPDGSRPWETRSGYEKRKQQGSLTVEDLYPSDGSRPWEDDRGNKRREQLKRLTELYRAYINLGILQRYCARMSQMIGSVMSTAYTNNPYRLTTAEIRHLLVDTEELIESRRPKK